MENVWQVQEQQDKNRSNPGNPNLTFYVDHIQTFRMTENNEEIKSEYHFMSKNFKENLRENLLLYENILISIQSNGPLIQMFAFANLWVASNATEYLKVQ